MTQTLQNTSMLDGRNVASLRVSGRFWARKATAKLSRAEELRDPGTEGSDRALVAHGNDVVVFRVRSVSMKGGEVPRQSPQMMTWITE